MEMEPLNEWKQLTEHVRKFRRDIFFIKETGSDQSKVINEFGFIESRRFPTTWLSKQDIAKLDDALALAFIHESFTLAYPSLQEFFEGHKLGSMLHDGSYRRLEWLGDAVLKWVASYQLFHIGTGDRRSRLNLEQLTERRANLENNAFLADRLEQMGFHKYVLVYPKRNHIKRGIYADVCEAIIGVLSLYLDTSRVARITLEILLPCDDDNDDNGFVEESQWPGWGTDALNDEWIMFPEPIIITPPADGGPRRAIG